MRFLRIVLPVLITPWMFPLNAQDPPQRDARALAVMQQSLAVMGGSVPTDSVATGRVSLIEGPDTDEGQVRLLTRGLDQFAERISTGTRLRAASYSRGRAKSENELSAKTESLIWATSSHVPSFPAVLVGASLSNSDFAFEYIGLEKVGASNAHHIRVWNTFSSQPKLRMLAPFTEKHIWIDAASGLPLKVYCEQRSAGGAVPAVPVEVVYSDYRNVNGVLYPFHIEKSLNGSLWATITIERVALNSGLADADFPVR